MRISVYDLSHIEKQHGTHIIFLLDIVSFIYITKSWKLCQNVFMSLSP